MKAAGKFAVAGAALAFAGALPATTAVAQEQVQTYRCVVVAPEGPGAVGQDCEALNGAPEEGPIFGTFRIETPRITVQCEVTRPFSGIANTPDSVEGRLCHPVR